MQRIWCWVFNNQRKAVLPDGASTSIIVLFIISPLLPFCWMVVTSLKTKGELFSLQFPLWIHHLTWENDTDLFALTQFGSWFANSALVLSGYLDYEQESH